MDAGNYSFAALATTDFNVERNPEQLESVVRAIARAQKIIREEPRRAAEVTRKLFPSTEAKLMTQILERDREFYRPAISVETITEMNSFATASGLLSHPVPYEQVVATQFQSLWSE